MKSLYKECLALGIEPESDEAVYVFAESVLYLVGASGAFDFQKQVKPFCANRSAKVFRLRLREHRYSNLNVKLYLMHLVLSKATKYQAKRLAQEYEIHKCDAKLIWMLLTTNVWFKKTVTRYVRVIGCELSDLDMQAINDTFDRVFPSVFKYIKHITYTKLRFLVRSTNSEFSEFHSALSEKLVKAFYAMVPISMSDEHLINYLKRSAHNHAINMIKMGTTQKRGRLISSKEDEKGNRQFAMLCLSQNQMPVSEAGELQDVDGKDESADLFELRFSISEVLDSIKNYSVRKYRFLTILLGAEDKEFTAWLLNTGVGRPGEDNVDVQHRLGAFEYTKLISRFLRVPEKHVDSFFASLKTQLAW